MKKMLLFLFICCFSKLAFSQTGDFYNHYFEGNALLVKGQWDKAIEKYTAASKLFEAAYVYYNRGNAYLGKKDYANAMLDFNRALKMNERYAEAYCQRGLVKLATSDNTACDDFKRAVKLELEEAKDIVKKNCK